MGVIRVQKGLFDVTEAMVHLAAGRPEVGAIVSFVGLVRDVSEGDPVRAMTLEHYPGMTEKALQRIVDEARSRWDIIDTVVIHRVGRLEPTEPIVLVAVSSGHRGAAFAACEFIMDYLKTRAPFWKREDTAAGSRWVEARESDADAAGRWGAGS